MTTYLEFRQSFQLEEVEYGIKIIHDGQPLQMIEDSDYWDANGFHPGKNSMHDVIIPTIELAENFLKFFFIGLASTNDAANWEYQEIDEETLVW